MRGQTVQDGVKLIGRKNDGDFEKDVPTPAPKETFRIAAGASVFVIGHGHFYGPAAGKQVQLLKEDGVGQARLMLVMHTDPHDTEAAKGGDDAHERAAKKIHDIKELATNPEFDALVICVGPRLVDIWKLDHLYELVPEDKFLRFDPGFDAGQKVVDVAEGSRRPIAQPRILIAGRLEDDDVKGFKTAMRAISAVAEAQRVAKTRIRPKIVALGIAAGADTDAFLRQINVIAGMEASAIPFTTNRNEYFRELRKASMLLMPSRAEGFGLVAQDAVAVGTPVVVADRSGFVRLLEGMPREVNVSGMSAPTPYVDSSDQDGDICNEWRDKITTIATHPETAREATIALRKHLLANAKQSAEKLVRRVRRSSCEM